MFGYSTSIVTDSLIWDATPAAFATHAANRSQAAQILGQLADSDLDVLFGELVDVGEGDVPGWDATLELLSSRFELLGADLATAKGTPIAAPANGIVLRTGNLFFDGNFVLVGHGLGLQSFYAHLDEIAVNKGDVLGVGQLLGTVGVTGRVTGPHLHWSIGLNGEWVDPMLLFDEF